MTTLTLFWSILLYTWVTPGIPTLDYARLRESADALQGLNAEDYNDVELIGEISRLDSLQRRIESYTTESALLSGLSFSSFLAIYFADKQEYRDNVASLFPVQLIEYPVPWTGNLPLIDQLRSIWLPSAAFLEAHVVGVISLALLCSAISFLGVLVARLPFNDGYREADRQLKGARLLNDKENQAIARDERHRVHNLSLAISQLRGNANMLRRGMEPTIQFMVFSRRAGLASFTLALMLCGTFFNSEIGAVILLVVLTVLAGGCGSSAVARHLSQASDDRHRATARLRRVASRLARATHIPHISAMSAARPPQSADPQRAVRDGHPRDHRLADRRRDPGPGRGLRVRGRAGAGAPELEMGAQAFRALEAALPQVRQSRRHRAAPPQLPPPPAARPGCGARRRPAAARSRLVAPCRLAAAVRPGAAADHRPPARGKGCVDLAAALLYGHPTHGRPKWRLFSVLNT
ncbi:MAG: hypothetical protein WDN24_19365 [Sphingomonas sp.]